MNGHALLSFVHSLARPFLPALLGYTFWPHVSYSEPAHLHLDFPKDHSPPVPIAGKTPATSWAGHYAGKMLEMVNTAGIEESLGGDTHIEHAFDRHLAHVCFSMVYVDPAYTEEHRRFFLVWGILANELIELGLGVRQDLKRAGHDRSPEEMEESRTFILKYGGAFVRFLAQPQAGEFAQKTQGEYIGMRCLTVLILLRLLKALPLTAVQTYERFTPNELLSYVLSEDAGRSFGLPDRKAAGDKRGLAFTQLIGHGLSDLTPAGRPFSSAEVARRFIQLFDIFTKKFKPAPNEHKITPDTATLDYSRYA
jgi:hypothetical protein